VDIADLALLPFKKARPGILAALNSEDPMRRYWGSMVCTAFGEDASEMTEDAKRLLNDPSLIVRVRAAEFLGRIGAINPQTTLTEVVNTTKNSVEATEALNSVVWFKDFFNDRYPVKRSDFQPVSNGADVDDRLNYINGIPYPPKQKRSKNQKKHAENSQKK